jgi:transcriptional repressor NrdR
MVDRLELSCRSRGEGDRFEPNRRGGDGGPRSDEVAYVRFASVYRQFKDINEFMSELKDLLARDRAESKG